MLGLLESLFSALDAPGAYTRGALSGQFGERVDGRGLLENWGVLGQNQEGLDFGDVLGFGAGVLTDPLTYASGGLGLLGKALGNGDDAARLLAGADVPPSLVGGWGAMDDLARTAPAGNLDQLALGHTPRPLLDGRRLMPDDFAAATYAKSPSGMPIKLFHGSPRGPVQAPDPSKWSDPESLLFGPGHYMTANPEVASTYASKDDVLRVGHNPAVSSYFLATKKPLDMTSELAQEEAVSILEAITRKFPENKFLGMELEDARSGLRESIADLRTQPEEFYEALAHEVGNREMNSILKGLGYDAIRHTGGTRTGRGKTLHDVWIALNPEQVYEPFLESQVKGKWL